MAGIKLAEGEEACVSELVSEKGCEVTDTQEIEYTLETIAAMSSPDELQDAIDALHRDVSHIQAQLEYRSDDAATDGWERRAVGALAFKRQLLAKAHHRLRGVKGHPAMHALAEAKNREAKTLKREINVQEQMLAMQRKAEKTDRLRVGAIQSTIDLLKRSRFERQFWFIAQSELDPETFGRLEALAQEKLDEIQIAILRRSGLTEAIDAIRNGQSPSPLPPEREIG
jgi:hypothetical protein